MGLLNSSHCCRVDGSCHWCIVHDRRSAMVGWDNPFIVIIFVWYCFHGRFSFHRRLHFQCGTRFDPSDVTCYPNLLCLWVKHTVDIARVIVGISHKDACFSVVIQLVLYCLCIVHYTVFAKSS